MQVLNSLCYFREGLDGGITKYRVFEVHWNIPDFFARLNNLKSGVRSWETVSLVEEGGNVNLVPKHMYVSKMRIICKLSSWKMMIECLYKVMLGEQKVTLALERDARYQISPLLAVL